MLEKLPETPAFYMPIGDLYVIGAILCGENLIFVAKCDTKVDRCHFLMLTKAHGS